MKKIGMIISSVLFLVLLVGCGTNNDVVDTKQSSEGFFLPCENDCYIIIIDDYGPTEMYPVEKDFNIFADLSVGDRIKIMNGMFEETYPARTEVYSVEKISDGSMDDIPTEIISELEEFGRVIKK